MKLLLTLFLFLASNVGAFDVVGSLPQGLGDGRYVQKAGDTMSGPLTLNGSSLTVTGNGEIRGSVFTVGTTTFSVSAGKVGINNVSTLSYPLTIGNASTVRGQILLGETGGNAGIESYQSLNINIDADGTQSDRHFSIRHDAAGESGGTELFRVQENGNFGIGTAVPASMLHVNGNALFVSTVEVQGNAFSVGGSTLVVANGNVGIGISAPSAKLDVAGTGNFTGSVTASSITVTGAGGVGVTFGVNAATGVFTNTGAASLDIGGGLNAGTGNVAIIDATGKITALSSTYLADLSGANLTALTAANISAGSLGSSVMASSVALAGFYSAPEVRTTLGVPGLADVNTFTSSQTVTAGGGLRVVYEVKAGSVSVSDTGAGALDVAGGINAGTGNVGIVDATGKIPALSTVYLADLSGANLTSLTAANVSAGSLGASVIASSITLSAMYGSPTFSTLTVTGSDFSVGGSTLVVTGGKVGIGDTAPEGTQGLTVNQGVNDDIIFALKSSDVGHGMTGIAETDSYLAIKKGDPTRGGPNIYGLTDTGDQTGLSLFGLVGNIAMDSGIASIRIFSGKYDGGTSYQSLSSSDTAVGFHSGNTKIISIMGSGGFKPYSRTLAQLQALAVSVGEVFYCSDCSPAKIVVSTGTSAGNFADAIGGTFQ